jgi:tetratricopeptide (TPR) repeat protein
MSVGVKRSVGFAMAGLLWLTGCETTSLQPPEILSMKSAQPGNESLAEAAAQPAATTAAAAETATAPSEAIAPPPETAAAPAVTAAAAAQIPAAAAETGAASAAGDTAPETTGSTTASTPGSVWAPLANWFSHHEVGDKGPPAEPLPPATPSKPNDDISLGRMNFRQGNYGLAEHYFRRAVQTGPREAEAWLGLAASYDRLRRFDLADRSYRQLYGLVGRTPEILNNQGYSFMLRGDFAHARKTLAEAQAKDPANPYIANNIALLEESVRTRRAVR